MKYLIVILLALTSCTWYRTQLEESAVRRIRNDLREWENVKSADCQYVLNAPLPIIEIGDYAWYDPRTFTAKYTNRDALEHELHHYYNDISNVSRRCLETQATEYRTLYKITYRALQAERAKKR